MSVKFKNPFSKQQIFRDITKESHDVVKATMSTLPADTIVKVYGCGESIIIHSKNRNTECASISNSKGYGYVQEWELVYMLENILKKSNNDVVMRVSPNGIIYLYVKDGVALVN
ncbi:DUF1827 family protein [Lysinibacillus sp. NPDC096418]|uniref:DUF1827 family protein n=1 Tax=Lysinibacillus sp. NPDC096418 TaxID=3364138 RepID=UPI0037F5B760